MMSQDPFSPPPRSERAADNLLGRAGLGAGSMGDPDGGAQPAPSVLHNPHRDDA